VNEAHQQLCGSPEWAAHLQENIFPALFDKTELGDEMLEMGPGAGAATDWLRHRVRRLTAVEVDPGAAEALQARFAGTNVHVVVEDCAHTSLPDESFDSVSSFTMLHHVPTLDLQRAVLEEALRLLRPGGALVGSDSIASNDLHHFHADDTYNPVDPAWMLIALQTAGFVDVSLTVGHHMTFVAHKRSESSPEPLDTDDPLGTAAARIPLTEPIAHEDPREGDRGGPACRYCAIQDGDAVWSNAHWRLVSRAWSPIPGGMLLLSKAHVDTLSDMPLSRQREFGQIAAAVEDAILSLGGVARVHLYRWGDGRAHFHVHFVPRPHGRPQFAARNLPFFEERLPHPGDAQLRAATSAVGAALTKARLPR
jgi:SAM-dependent methyltransferase